MPSKLMKIKLKFRNMGIILSVLLFSMIVTACEKISEEGSSVISTDKILTEITTVTTKVPELPTSCIIISDITDDPILESATYEEKQIVAAILMDIFRYSEQSALHDADDSINDAKTLLSERVLGEVTSEEDAIEKARVVLIEKNGT